MNPWEIVSWIGAACVGILIGTLTVSLVISMVRSTVRPRRTSSENIYRTPRG